MISTFWGYRLVRVGTDSDRSDRMRRMRVRNGGDDDDSDDDAESEAEGVAEALSGGVVHVTQTKVKT